MVLPRTIKKNLKPFLITNVLLIIYTLILIILFDAFYKSKELTAFKFGGTLLVLIILYSWINVKVSLGKWKLVFFVPLIPYTLYLPFLFKIYYYFVPNKFIEDDLGGIALFLTINTIHYFSILISFLLVYITDNNKATY